MYHTSTVKRLVILHCMELVFGTERGSLIEIVTEKKNISMYLKKKMNFLVQNNLFNIYVIVNYFINNKN